MTKTKDKDQDQRPPRQDMARLYHQDQDHQKQDKDHDPRPPRPSRPPRPRLRPKRDQIVRICDKIRKSLDASDNTRKQIIREDEGKTTGNKTADKQGKIG